MGTQLIESPIEYISKSSKVNPIRLIPQPGQSLENLLYCPKVIDQNLQCIEKKELFFEFIRQGIKHKSIGYGFRHLLGHQGVKSIVSIKGLNKDLIDKLQQPHIIVYAPHESHEQSILMTVFSYLITGKKLEQIGSRKVANLHKSFLNIIGLTPRNDGGIYKLMDKARQGKNIAIAPEGDINRQPNILMKFHNGFIRIKDALWILDKKDIPFLLVRSRGHVYSDKIPDKIKEIVTIKKLLAEASNKEWEIKKNGGRYRVGTCFEVMPRLIYNADLNDETKGGINLIKELEKILLKANEYYPNIEDIFYTDLEDINMPNELKNAIKENTQRTAHIIAGFFSEFWEVEYDPDKEPMKKKGSFKKCVFKEISEKGLENKVNFEAFIKEKKIGTFSASESNYKKNSLFINTITVDKKYNWKKIYSKFINLLKEYIDNYNKSNGKKYNSITAVVPNKSEELITFFLNQGFKIPQNLINVTRIINPEKEYFCEYKIPKPKFFSELFRKKEERELYV